MLILTGGQRFNFVHVLKTMTRPSTPSPIATVVPRPRAADAIGAALRDAFGREPRLPDDMMVLLARLNGVGARRGSGGPQCTAGRRTLSGRG